MAEVDWTAVNNKLPTGKDLESKKRRWQMFNEFDPNGNGVCSLAEVDKSVRDVLGIDAIFNAKPAIMRAFQIAKDSEKSKRADIGDDYLELKEFRYFLLALRQYFEYWNAFMRVDSDGDRRINIEEFRAAKDKIEVWVGPIADMDKEFKKIDLNGGGQILFDEFCKWAIKMNLDLEDDDDDIAGLE